MIKVGIVGVRGFSVVGAMKAMPDEVKITAMCDLDEDCLNRAKEEIGLEDSQCYRIYDDMLEKADIDAVVISTPMLRRQFLRFRQASTLCARLPQQ